MDWKSILKWLATVVVSVVVSTTIAWRFIINVTIINERKIEKMERALKAARMIDE